MGSTQSASEIRCAYPFGASVASITSDLGAARALSGQMQQRMAAQDLPHCWQLSVDECVVAFQDLALFMKEEAAEDHFVERLSWVFAAVCFLIATGAKLCQFKEDRDSLAQGAYS